MATMAMTEKLKVLFLCTGNVCRSQMSKGWARVLKGDVIEPYSAGIAPAGVDPRATKVMAEVGVDISGHSSKHVDALVDVPLDYVVTVCDKAAESCPVFPAKRRRSTAALRTHHASPGAPRRKSWHSATTAECATRSEFPSRRCPAASRDRSLSHDGGHRPQSVLS